VPSSATSDDDLLQHVMRTTGLPAGSAARVIADVKAYFDESVEDFVRRRHHELQARGLTNDPIFERITAELRDRPVAAPELTVRQLRRLVYG
jgi:cytidylate kinase